MPSGFQILTVCTGNICRSPAAEFMLREHFKAAIQISSAGTGAVVGAGVDPRMARLLAVDSSGFRARQLTPQMIRNSALILTATRAHRSQVVESFPAAVRRTFTLREFARMATIEPIQSSSSDERLAQIIADSGRLRPLSMVSDPAENDISDPYCGTSADFEHAHAAIAEAVGLIARAGDA